MYCAGYYQILWFFQYYDECYDGQNELEGKMWEAQSQLCQIICGKFSEIVKLGGKLIIVNLFSVYVHPSGLYALMPYTYCKFIYNIVKRKC